MRAVVLSVGNELLRGDIVDTNAAFLARELSQLGFHVERIEQIGDDLEAMVRAVSSAQAIADVTLCTGGLGPTQDDLTRQAIAASLGEELYEDPALVAEIEDRFGSMRRRMPASNRRQALMIRSAEPIPNPNGTAPGWFVRRDGKFIAAMPGPPGEMRPMWRDWVMRRLEGLFPGHFAMLSFMTFGLGESAVEDRISDLLAWHSDVILATYAKSEGVQVHATVRADTEQDVARLRADVEQQVRQRLGEAIFGTGDDTLAGAVGTMLGQGGLTLAVMESASGGELANLITNFPGSSEYFVGGIVAYTRSVKASFGVDSTVMDRHGLISEQTARSMADAVRSHLGADVGLSTTGIAGADPVEGKPPGTCYVAVSTPGAHAVREIHRPGSRGVAKHFFAQCALDLLRREFSAAERAHV